MFSSYLDLEKNGSQLFRAGQKLLQLFGEKKVDPCYLEIKKFSSKLVEAREKIMTCI